MTLGVLMALVAACGGDDFAATYGSAPATPTPEVDAGTAGTSIVPDNSIVVSPTATLEPALRTETVEYTVVSGDFLGRIASNYGVTVDAIIDANPGLNANTIQIGQTIFVPPPGGNSTSAGDTTDDTLGQATATPLATSTPIPTRERAEGVTENYTVASGDQLSVIATIYGVSLEALAEANSVEAPYTLTPGQILTVPPVGTGISDS